MKNQGILIHLEGATISSTFWAHPALLGFIMWNQCVQNVGQGLQWMVMGGRTVGRVIRIFPL